MLFPVLLLLIVLQFNGISVPQFESDSKEEFSYVLNHTADVTESGTPVSKAAKEVTSNVHKKSDGNMKDSIVNYALTLLGSPYVYGGDNSDGFDCSGFIVHVFDQNGITVKRSSGLQSTEGVAVDRNEAAPGDLVIFTGTDKSVRQPGHVGIVISEPGDTIQFIHSSSSRRESGVKISKVEGSGYDDRFLGIRRIL